MKAGKQSFYFYPFSLLSISISNVDFSSIGEELGEEEGEEEGEEKSENEEEEEEEEREDEEEEEKERGNFFHIKKD